MKMSKLDERYDSLFDPEEDDEEEYYEEEIQQPHPMPRKQVVYQEQQVDDGGFGDTRDATKIAKEIEANPTPPGILPIRIAGRPIDLHMFEDYMVWKISPFQLRTVLRYRNARVMEEMKNYSSSPIGKMKGSTILLIMFAIMMLIGGVMILLFMPDIMAMFKGFI